MKKKILAIAAMVISFFSLFVFVPEVQGDGLGFSVRTILPENQRDRGKSYFDLRMTPGTKQVIQVELTNNQEEAITVMASANSAITNDNGVVDYSHAKITKDSSAKTIFSEIATLPQNIQVPKKSKKVVDITLTMPAESYDGYILGGLYFEQKNADKNQDQSQDAVTIKNNYSYVVGVLLSETEQLVVPELKLNAVKSEQINLNNAVSMNIQNSTSALIPKLDITAKLYYEDETKPSYERRQDNVKMAPNSNFNYRILLKGQPFVAGNYTAKITATDGTHQWQWSKSFEVKEKEAKKYNQTASNLPPTPKNTAYMWLLAIIGLLAATLLGLFIYLYKQKHRQQEKL